MQDDFAEDAPKIEQVMRLEDEGESLIVSTPEPGGEIASSLAYIAAGCVLEKTNAPATVSAQMTSTTAMASSVDAEWDDIQATWTYAAGIEGSFSATFAFTG
ncbi:hypothetical protein L615_007500000080 [Nocardioides sp. J9]|uniref:hypothetical protein n=1 Tax=Nocardioides sp. J9 TaxID=935844 RepID=UPI0011A9EA6E|nr:hypothetical protein [Nocardioides sp. J9]TWG91998.1 hypothetical protein L615_007500000080 [Nocardioides sp. J9]